MIARFHVLLPFAFSIPDGTQLEPYEVTHSLYKIVVYPPFRAVGGHQELRPNAPIPLLHIPELLKPEEPQTPTDDVLVEGVRTIQANLIRVDFHKQEFDRRVKAPEPAGFLDSDPPSSLVVEIVNDLVTRLRHSCPRIFADHLRRS